MKLNKVIAALSILTLLTVSSYSLAKFRDERIYVIRIVNDSSNQPVQEQEEPEESEYILQPQLVFETEYQDDQIYPVAINEAGIYAVQLYGGSISGNTSSYAAGYLEVAYPINLNFQLGGNQPEAIVSSLTKAGEEEAILSINEETVNFNAEILSQVLQGSELEKLLAAREGRGAGKLVISYLGSLEEAQEIEAMNSIAE